MKSKISRRNIILIIILVLAALAIYWLIEMSSFASGVIEDIPKNELKE